VENLSLTLSLLFAGLIIGILLSLAMATIISGFCDALAPGSSPRRSGFVMLMLYLPCFLFLMRNMTEVMPMIVGVMLGSTFISIAILIKNIQTIKNPLPLTDAGSVQQTDQAN
jgi:hypothetical protein